MSKIELKDYSEIPSKITIKLKDYSEIEIDSMELLRKASIPFKSKKNVGENLGIYRTQGNRYRTDKYCGYMWLKNGNEMVTDKEGENILIHIRPRFQLDLNVMIKKIAEDEEFFVYLGMDTDDPLITYFTDEQMIDEVPVEDNNYQLLTLLSYVTLLERLTRSSLMTKSVKVRENYVGRVCGRIVMNKQISGNIMKGHQERVFCEFNERTADIAENQILKQALYMADDYFEKKKQDTEKRKASQKQGDSVQSEVYGKIKLLKKRFSRVTDNRSYAARDIDCLAKKLPNIYRNYLPVFNLAKIILSSLNVGSEPQDINETEVQKAKIIPYAINSHKLFECYARACIKSCIRQIMEESKDSCKIEMLKYVPDPKNALCAPNYGARQILKEKDSQCYIDGIAVPDIVLKYTDEQKTFYRVYDVKYKDITREDMGREDRLQLLAYNLLYNGNNNTSFIFPYPYPYSHSNDIYDTLVTINNTHTSDEIFAGNICLFANNNIYMDGNNIYAYWYNDDKEVRWNKSSLKMMFEK